ncbi:MAG: PqqD family protein [Oligoflexia bacterium]|nr:PqqD family protein [Oligoflexia bacterium]
MVSKKQEQLTCKQIIPIRAPDAITRRHATGVLNVFRISKQDVVYDLDGVAAQVWLRIDGRTTAEEIVSMLLKKYYVSRSRLSKDITRLLLELKVSRLITLKIT